MSSDPKMDAALDVLRKHGHEIGMAVASEEGHVMIAVDGRPLRFHEIYEMEKRVAREHEAAG